MVGSSLPGLINLIMEKLIYCIESHFVKGWNFWETVGEKPSHSLYILTEN